MSQIPENEWWDSIEHDKGDENLKRPEAHELHAMWEYAEVKATTAAVAAQKIMVIKSEDYDSVKACPDCNEKHYPFDKGDNVAEMIFSVAMTRTHLIPLVLDLLDAIEARSDFDTFEFPDWEKWKTKERLNEAVMCECDEWDENADEIIHGNKMISDDDRRILRLWVDSHTLYARQIMRRPYSGSPFTKVYPSAISRALDEGLTMYMPAAAPYFVIAGELMYKGIVENEDMESKTVTRQAESPRQVTSDDCLDRQKWNSWRVKLREYEHNEYFFDSTRALAKAAADKMDAVEKT